MIDVENKVFNTIAQEVRNQFLANYPNLTLYGEYVPAPQKHPCISLFEQDNATYQASATLDSRENHAVLTYAVAIETNDIHKKQTARKIAGVINDKMLALGFERLYMDSNKKTSDSFTIEMAFTGVVSKGVQSGNDTHFYVYRR